MQRDTAENLHVVGHHVPLHGLAGALPRAAQEPAAGLDDHGEGFGHDFFEKGRFHVADGFVQLSVLVVELLALFRF